MKALKNSPPKLGCVDPNLTFQPDDVAKSKASSEYEILD
jgi:hypothetical protein